jgi:hypothetical protein
VLATLEPVAGKLNRPKNKAAGQQDADPSGFLMMTRGWQEGVPSSVLSGKSKKMPYPLAAIAIMPLLPPLKAQTRRHSSPQQPGFPEDKPPLIFPSQPPHGC